MKGIKIRRPKLRLNEILRKQGRKKKWLAEQLGVSMDSVGHWCRKINCPDTETVSKIVELLGIEKSELYAKSDPGWSKFLPEIFKP